MAVDRPSGVNLQDMMVGANEPSKIAAELRFTVDEASVIQSLNKMMEVTDKQQKQMEKLQAKMWESIFGRPQEQIQKLTDATGRMFTQMIRQISENVARGGAEAIDLIKDRLQQAAAEIPEMSRKLYEANLPPGARGAAMAASGLGLYGSGMYRQAALGNPTAQRMMMLGQGAEGYHGQMMSSGGQYGAWPVANEAMSPTPFIVGDALEAMAMGGASHGAEGMASRSFLREAGMVGGPALAMGMMGAGGHGDYTPGVSTPGHEGGGGGGLGLSQYSRAFGGSGSMPNPTGGMAAASGRADLNLVSGSLAGRGGSAASLAGQAGANALAARPGMATRGLAAGKNFMTTSGPQMAMKGASRIPLVGGMASRGIGMLGAAAGPLGLGIGAAGAAIAISEFFNNLHNVNEAFSHNAEVVGQSLPTMLKFNAALSSLGTTTFLTAEQLGQLGGGLQDAGFRGGSLLGNLSAGASMMGSYGASASTATGMLMAGRNLGIAPYQSENLLRQASLGAQFTNMNPQGMQAMQLGGMQLAQGAALGNTGTQLGRLMPLALSNGIDNIKISGLSDNPQRQQVMMQNLGNPMYRAMLQGYGGGTMKSADQYMASMNNMAKSQLTALQGIDPSSPEFQFAAQNLPIVKMMGMENDMMGVANMVDLAKKGHSIFDITRAHAADDTAKSAMMKSSDIWSGINKQGLGSRMGDSTFGWAGHLFGSSKETEAREARQAKWDRLNNLDNAFGKVGMPKQLRDKMLGMDNKDLEKMKLTMKSGSFKGKTLDLGYYAAHGSFKGMTQMDSMMITQQMKNDKSFWKEADKIKFGHDDISLEKYLTDEGNIDFKSGKITHEPGSKSSGKSVKTKNGVTITLDGSAAQMFNLMTTQGQSENNFAGG